MIISRTIESLEGSRAKCMLCNNPAVSVALIVNTRMKGGKEEVMNRRRPYCQTHMQTHVWRMKGIEKDPRRWCQKES